MAKRLYIKNSYIKVDNGDEITQYPQSSLYDTRSGFLKLIHPRGFETTFEDPTEWINTELGSETYTAATMEAFLEKNSGSFNDASNGARFVEEKTAITGTVGVDWVVRSLGVAYANKTVQIMVEKTGAAQANAGARSNFLPPETTAPFLVFKENGGDEREIEADGNGDIQIWSDNGLVNFYLIGSK